MQRLYTRASVARIASLTIAAPSSLPQLLLRRTSRADLSLAGKGKGRTNMMTRMIKTAMGVAGIVMVIVSNTMAGGPIQFQWDNTSSQVSEFEAPFYLTFAPALLDPVGNLIQLVAIQGGTNYVLAASSIGQNSATLAQDAAFGWISAAPFNGLFDLVSTVPSNIVKGAVGSPMGVAFYAGPTMASYYGIVENLSINVPSPDYGSPPAVPTIFEPDVQNPAYLGLQTTGSPSTTTQGAKGYFEALDITPEPSSFILVGAALMGLLAVHRRKR